MSTQTNHHKRGRPLDRRLTHKSQQQFLAAGVEVEIEEPRSDSEYDSDAIVVGKGRKCPRVSEAPPNYAPSVMRMLSTPQLSPQLATSPPPRMETAIPNLALLEWYLKVFRI
jgi:hypothetical protein